MYHIIDIVKQIYVPRSMTERGLVAPLGYNIADRVGGGNSKRADLLSAERNNIDHAAALTEGSLIVVPTLRAGFALIVMNYLEQHEQYVKLAPIIIMFTG